MRRALRFPFHERLSAGLDRALAMLEEAHATSTLPEEAPNRDALDAWLLETRLATGMRRVYPTTGGTP